jgi:hypothetical protein
MSHGLIDAAPSNASELSPYVESLREHLLAPSGELFGVAQAMNLRH